MYSQPEQGMVSSLMFLFCWHTWHAMTPSWSRRCICTGSLPTVLANAAIAAIRHQTCKSQIIIRNFGIRFAFFGLKFSLLGHSPFWLLLGTTFCFRSNWVPTCIGVNVKYQYYLIVSLMRRIPVYLWNLDMLLANLALKRAALDWVTSSIVAWCLWSESPGIPDLSLLVDPYCCWWNYW